MRAAVVTDWNGPEGLTVMDVPSPPLGADEVRIAVKAVSYTHLTLPTIYSV